MAGYVCQKIKSLQKDQIDMSLLDEAFESFTIIDRITTDDGYGGVITEWRDGASIQGALVFDSSSEMKVAQSLGSTAAYTLTVRKNINLDYHTVIRRESDGHIFRVLSNSDDRKTPKSAGLNMLQYSAEEWVLN